MNTVHAADAARKMSIRATILGGALGVSILGNMAMAVCVATMQKVVMVPSLVDTVEVRTGGAIDRDYLERLSRDATYLFLNRTPETAQYFEQQIERITEPATYQAIKSQLIADRQKRREDKTSQTFFPLEWYIKPGQLYVEVTGSLQTSDGTQIVERETKFYALRFVRHGTAVRLLSFEEIAAKDRLGAQAKIVSEDAQ